MKKDYFKGSALTIVEAEAARLGQFLYTQVVTLSQIEYFCN